MHHPIRCSLSIHYLIRCDFSTHHPINCNLSIHHPIGCNPSLCLQSDVTSLSIIQSDVGKVGPGRRYFTDYRLHVLMDTNEVTLKLQTITLQAHWTVGKVNVKDNVECVYVCACVCVCVCMHVCVCMQVYMYVCVCAHIIWLPILIYELLTILYYHPRKTTVTIPIE